MKVRTFFNIIVFFILLSLSACQTKKAYIGPRQKSDCLATIKAGGNPDRIGEYNVLFKVDSIPVNTAHDNYRFRKCVVLPGTHTIEFSIYNTISSNGIFKRYLFIGTYLVTFDAKAGKTYIIETETDSETSLIDVFVTEEKNGEQVPSTVDYYYHLKEKE